MAIKVIDGVQYDVPDYYTDADVVALSDSLKAPRQTVSPLSNTPSAGGPSPISNTSGIPPNGEEWDPRKLFENDDFVTAAEIRYRWKEGKNFVPKDAAKRREELAVYGLEQMARTYNELFFGIDAVEIKKAPTEVQKSYLTLLNTFTNVDESWDGFKRAFPYVITSPTFLAGAALAPFTGGTGAFAGFATRKAALESLKAALKKGLPLAIEGAIGAGLQEGIDQTARINAGDPNLAGGYNLGRVAGQAGIGAGINLAAGGAINLAARGINRLAGGQLDNQVPTPTVTAQGASQAVPVAPSGIQNAVPLPSGGTVAPNVGTAAPNAAPAAPNAASAAPNAAQAVPNADVDTVVNAIRSIAHDSGARTFPREFLDITQYTKSVVQTLRQVSAAGADNVMETLSRLARTEEQRDILIKSLPQARAALGVENRQLVESIQSISDPQIKKTLTAQLEAQEQLAEAIADIDQRLASLTGSGLGFRAAPENTFTGTSGFRLSMTNVAEEQGVVLSKATPEQLDAIRTEYYRRYDDLMAGKVQDQEIARLRGQFAEAQRTGDLEKMIKVNGEVMHVAEQKAQAALKNDPVVNSIMSKIGGGINTTIRGITEFVTATVLGPSSLAVNALSTGIKVLYKPLVNYIAKGPLDAAAAKEMTATYGAMRSVIGSSLAAAKEAFLLERNILTDQPNKWLEGKNVLPGQTGGFIRVFLRMLTATDEFFAQMTYRGAIAGRAAAEAVEKGLSKADFDKYVDEQVRKAYTKSGIDFDTISMLRAEANRKGLSGEAANLWVKNRLETNPDLYKRALDQAGINYTDDVLFKRDFSKAGDGYAGAISRAADTYQRMVADQPVIKLLGQLFFKTPVRVFEEGIRMTPGLNFIAPRFVDDLKGVNGMDRQVRAMGEAMLGYSIVSWAVLMYAQGKLTGGGDEDYRKRRGQEDTKNWKPYAYKMDDGTYISFRNLDPLATPLKIVANVMQRIQDIEYRKRQGQQIDQTEFQEALMWLGVATGSAAQAVRDASLVEGASQMVDLVTTLTDPDEKSFQRFIGQKSALIVPNLIGRSQRTFVEGQNVMSDPITAEQYIRAKINPTDPLVSRQFDHLGYERRIDATGPAAFLGFDITTVEDRTKGYSKEAMYVKDVIGRLEKALDRSLYPTFKTDKWPGKDIRQELTEDGLETVYNRAMGIMRKSNLEKDLYKMFTQLESRGTLIFGTPTKDGKDNSSIALKAFKGIYDSYWDQALEQVLQNDSRAKKKRLQSDQYQMESFIGLRDVQ